MGALNRHRPRKPRNAYRDNTWMRAIVRSWAARLGHADLTTRYRQLMQETDMQNTLEIEITVKGRDRVHCLPRICPSNTEPATARLDWLRRTSACDQAVLQEAERIIGAIAKASP